MRIINPNKSYSLIVSWVVDHFPEIKWGLNPFMVTLPIQEDVMVVELQATIGSSVHIHCMLLTAVKKNFK